MIHVPDELRESTLDGTFRHFAYDIDAALATVFTDFEPFMTARDRYHFLCPRSVFACGLNTAADTEFLDDESKNNILTKCREDILTRYRDFSSLLRRGREHQCAASLSRMFAGFFVVWFLDRSGYGPVGRQQYGDLADAAKLAGIRIDCVFGRRFVMHRILAETVEDIERYADSRIRKEEATDRS